jgi:hypothetical protein
MELLQPGVNQTACLSNVDLTAVMGDTASSWSPQASLTSQRTLGIFPSGRKTNWTFCQDSTLIMQLKIDRAQGRRVTKPSSMLHGTILTALRICQSLLAILTGCLPRSLLFLHNTTLFKATCSDCRLLVSCLAYSPTLKMKVTCTSKMLLDFHWTNTVLYPRR